MKKIQGKLVVIVGPTASGKTDLALSLAKKFKGEIISADSRQVYKEMKIGTARPDNTKGIPYHLVGMINPDKDFNAAIFKKKAVRIIKEIHKRKKIPFLVGGTGLYIKAVTDNMNFPVVAADEKLRKCLEKKSLKSLFDIYKKLDPEGAESIDKENKRRLVRAIEVCKVTGRSFWQQRKSREPEFEMLEIGIRMPKKELRNKIKKRVELMLQKGLEEEAGKLNEKYGPIPPLRTIGYQEWNGYFEGKAGKEEVKNLIISHTNQFARRQMTWFRKDKRIRWIRKSKEAGQMVREFLK